MDPEYKEYFYTREPSLRGYPKIGDISKQIQFKKDHKCKSFKWFMDNVAYDVFDQFPKLPPNKAWGEVSYSFFYYLKQATSSTLYFSLMFQSKIVRLVRCLYDPIPS